VEKDQVSALVSLVKLIKLGKFVSQKGILFIGTDLWELLCATFS